MQWKQPFARQDNGIRRGRDPQHLFLTQVAAYRWKEIKNERIPTTNANSDDRLIGFFDTESGHYFQRYYQNSGISLSTVRMASESHLSALVVGFDFAWEEHKSQRFQTRKKTLHTMHLHRVKGLRKASTAPFLPRWNERKTRWPRWYRLLVRCWDEVDPSRDLGILLLAFNQFCKVAYAQKPSERRYITIVYSGRNPWNRTAAKITVWNLSGSIQALHSPSEPPAGINTPRSKQARCCTQTAKSSLSVSELA